MFLCDINDSCDKILTDMCNFIIIHILLDCETLLFYSICCCCLCVSYFESFPIFLVHWLPLIILLSVHLSYGFNTRPWFFMVSLYRLYHSKADSIHPYSDFNNIKYSTFILNSFQTCCLYYGFTLNIIYTKPSPVSTIHIFILACQH